MNRLLRDLYDHQVWADAEHWRAIGAYAMARDDRAIRDRLHHIALVQRLFLWAVGNRQDAFAFTKSEEFPSFDALRTYARDHHDRLAPAIAGARRSWCSRAYVRKASNDGNSSDFVNANASRRSPTAHKNNRCTNAM